MLLRSDLAIECFEKTRRGRPLKPLQSLKDFCIIYDGSGRGEKSPTRSSGQTTQDRAKSQSSPVRRARSLSPVKESSATASRDTTQRGKTTTTGVPKSTSLYPPQSSGKEKKAQLESAGVRNDAAKQGLETVSATRIRQGRRAKEVGSVSSDFKANGLSADETTKTADSTRGKAAPTSSKSAVNLKNGTSKEPQSQKKKISGDADNYDHSPSVPSRGS